MDLRIEKLQEKYWAGETSLAEEKELKTFFRENPSLLAEGQYYTAIQKKKKESPERSFAHPGRKNYRSWWSAAAAILILISVGFFILQNNNRTDQFAVEDPKEAYEITRASLMKVSEGLNKGKTYSKELNKINKAKETITY